MKDLIIKSKLTITLLIGIILLAGVLRLWQLGNVPISPDWDEVALGYDAYSFIHTGRDEYGKFLPVVLRSFDDYKPALYAYLSVPTIFLFGVTSFAVRLPSAIFGILTVIATFFFVKELFKRNDLALLSSFLLAISPWHIQFSRIAFESNVGMGLNLFAALFFIKGLKRPWLLILSAICAALSLYVYQSEKVFTPLLLLSLLLIYLKDFIRLPRMNIAIFFVTGILMISPMVYAIVTDTSSLLRAKGTSVFQDQAVLLKENIILLEQDKANNDVLGLLVDNRRVVYAKTIISGYLSHFNPNWFIRGDIARHHAPDMGLLYLWEIPFILMGIYILCTGPFSRKTKAIIFTWLLLAPIPASITTGVPHAVRTLNFLPMWQILAAVGILNAWVLLEKKHGLIRYTTIGLISLFAMFNFSYYLNQYFVQQNYFHASEWQYGYAQAVFEVEKLKPQYKKIVVSDNNPLDKSYMFFLFYLKYPPAKYQEVGQHSSGGFAEHHAFDIYEFRRIDWSKDRLEKDVLYVGRPEDFSDSPNTIKTINNPDGSPAIVIVGT